MSNYYQPEIETMPYEQMRALQNERFMKQIKHVWDNVPYYRKKMEDKGITLDDIIAGLQSALDGDFAPNDEDEVELAARCVLHLRDESFDFDAADAEILAQIIMFGSIIYA